MLMCDWRARADLFAAQFVPQIMPMPLPELFFSGI